MFNNLNTAASLVKTKRAYSEEQGIAAVRGETGTGRDRGGSGHCLKICPSPHASERVMIAFLD